MVCDCSAMSCVLVGLVVAGAYFLYKFLKARALEKKLERWSNRHKDKVVVHGFPASKIIVQASPFVLKVQTYLRMANIPYEMDIKDMWGPKGKSPWISYNGQHVPDSEFIVQFLKKKFEKNLNSKYTEKDLALADAVRIMLEEHAFWGLALERIAFSSSSSLKKVADFPFFIRIFYKHLVMKRAKGQGIGVHSQEEIEKIVIKDLRIVSTVLGQRKFILGDEPCEVDASIFGMIAQFVWGLPDSVYERLVNGELKNLKEYCERMKQKYWADWDLLLAK